MKGVLLSKSTKEVFDAFDFSTFFNDWSAVAYCASLGIAHSVTGSYAEIPGMVLEDDQRYRLYPNIHCPLTYTIESTGRMHDEKGEIFVTFSQRVHRWYDCVNHGYFNTFMTSSCGATPATLMPEERGRRVIYHYWV